MDDIQISKMELESATDFQKEMHTAIGKEPITSIYYKDYVKTTWNCTHRMPLTAYTIKEPNNDSDDVGALTVMRYILNPEFHYLNYTYLKCSLSLVKVKSQYVDEIRIAWPHNIGTAIIKKGIFKDDDILYQSFDNIWLDDYFQWYMQSGVGKERIHDIGIGCVPILEEWNHVLPAYPINIHQPWYYSEEAGLAYNIDQKGSKCKAEHIYHYQLNPTELIRMQREINGVWKDIDPRKFAELYLEPIAPIRKPSLWGQYGYVTNSELNTPKCKNNMKNRVFYYKDIEVYDSEKTYNYGQTMEVSINSKRPCLAMFWKAENMNATKNNNFSNYTSNTDDLMLGWDPIKHNSLKYGENYKFNSMESDHFTLSEARYHFPSAPRYIGYHAKSFGNDSSKYDGEVGIVLGPLNAKLACYLEKPDMYKMAKKSQMYDDEDEYVQEQNPSFKLRVRLLVLKKLTITLVDNQYIFKVE